MLKDMLKTFFGKKKRLIESLEEGNHYLQSKNGQLGRENATLRRKLHKLRELVPRDEAIGMFCPTCEKVTRNKDHGHSRVKSCTNCGVAFAEIHSKDIMCDKIRAILYDK